MKKTYCVKVAYDGSCFSGWAKQRKQNVRTVQDEIEKIISIIVNEDINIYASGRTDKYVHAIDQCFHFKTSFNLDKKILFKLMRINSPKDIFFKSIKLVDNDFHSRFNIKYKTYMYKVNVGEFNLFERNYSLQYNKDISISKIRKASKLFIGTKNFLSFSTSDSDNNIRTIQKIKITKKDKHVFIFFQGTGFLRSMVRMIVGTLLNFNEDKVTLEQISELFSSPKKGASQNKADGGGLYLFKTVY